MCNYKNCFTTPIISATMEDNEDYDLCLDCILTWVDDFQDKFEKGYLFLDYAKNFKCLKCDFKTTSQFEISDHLFRIHNLNILKVTA